MGVVCTVSVEYVGNGCGLASGGMTGAQKAKIQGQRLQKGPGKARPGKARPGTKSAKLNA